MTDRAAVLLIWLCLALGFAAGFGACLAASGRSFCGSPKPSRTFEDGTHLWKLCDGAMGIYVIGKDEAYKTYTWPGSCK